MATVTNTEPAEPCAGIRLIVDKECALAGASQALSSGIRERLTIKNPKYDAAVRYGRWVGKQLKPKLYFFRESGDRLIFPRGFANQAVVLCRKYSGCSPAIIDNRRLLDPVEFSFSGKLRPYQQQAVTSVLGRSFGVLEAGTGSGKTVMALKILAERKQPTMIIVHSRELLHQWQERIEEFLGIEAGQAGGGRFNIQPVTVGIVNTVRNRLAELTSLFGHLIVDECHRVPASLFTDVVSGFDAWFMLGLSATAFRREDGMTKVIYTYMGDRVHLVDSDELVKSGAIVRPEYICRETEFTYGFRGEYSKLIKALAKNEARNDQIAGDIAVLLESGHPGTVLIVSDRVAHCRVLQEKLAALGHDAALLTGRVHPEERERIVARVRAGNISALISTLQLIGEGFDCPGLTTIVLATPIKFEGRLLQVVGRVMRPAKGKSAKVIDYADVGVPVLRRSAEKRRELFDRWGEI
ncbi:MAG TPA: DEAD/DEAH box helicase [Desulfobulbaceae bacterium]|nr:DEAD/DEAH box helicase [Desulfobulbaceae bacterium]